MLTHRRRQLAAGNHHFTFSNPVHRADKPPNGIEYSTWAERIKGKHSYFGKPDDLKLGAWTRRTPWKDEHEYSDIQSPILWNKSGSPSPIRDHIHPSSRAQTIARSRQEMLDMVRDMPEPAYELSLRDIVESPRMKGREEDLKDKSEEGKEEEGKKMKKVKRVKKKISRSESMDAGGSLLKMFVSRIPIPFGSWRRSSGNSGTGAKVLPNPMIEKSTDSEWWNKEEFGEMSSSSSSSSRRRKMSCCYSFFRAQSRESRGI